MTEALSLRLAISWSVIPLNTLFRHLFCAAAVMHGMLWVRRRERGSIREGGRRNHCVRRTTRAGQRERVQRLVTILGQVILLCSSCATFSGSWTTNVGEPFKIKASIDTSSLKNLDQGLRVMRPSIIKAGYRKVRSCSDASFTLTGLVFEGRRSILTKRQAVQAI